MSKQDNTVGRPGEFRGDFTRDTFDPTHAYSRVFMQQGRVSIDADWNEQVAILHHYQRLFTTAAIGPHAAPWDCELDFKLSVTGDEYRMHRGHYFVHGLLCHNPAVTEPVEISDLFGCNDNELDDGHYLLYLDVWERHLTYLEDDGMREVALGDADTASRAQIVWAVRGIELDADSPLIPRVDDSGNITAREHDYDDFLIAIDTHRQPGDGRMRARAEPSANKQDLCASDSDGGYRGKENQLYRVEILYGSDSDEPSFKWSRDNSAVTFPVTAIQGETISLEHLGRDACGCLKVNDWVEIITAGDNGHCGAAPLYRITAIDTNNYQLTLSSAYTGNTDAVVLAHAYLRLWNNADGGADGIALAKASDGWYELEDGIEIRFDEDGRYTSGDYWLIPARSATNGIEWPADSNGKPQWRRAHGTVHYYAPLAVLSKNPNDGWQEVLDCRRVISRNWQPVPQDLTIEEDTDDPRPSAGGVRAKKVGKKKKKSKTKKKAGKKTG